MKGRKNIYGLLKLKPFNRFVGLDLICFLSPPCTISIGLYPNYGLSFDKYLITDISIFQLSCLCRVALLCSKRQNAWISYLYWNCTHKDLHVRTSTPNCSNKSIRMGSDKVVEKLHT
jgi:hypothetical protein